MLSLFRSFKIADNVISNKILLYIILNFIEERFKNEAFQKSG